jgi:hypothetical protein
MYVIKWFKPPPPPPPTLACFFFFFIYRKYDGAITRTVSTKCSDAERNLRV